MVSRKALFNVAIQIIPILASLFAIPISISNLGKPLWFFYSLGITVLFLPNYFAFGAGPYLVRNLVQKNNFLLTKKWKGCISAIIISSIVYVLFSKVDNVEVGDEELGSGEEETNSIEGAGEEEVRCIKKVMQVGR